MTRLVLEISNQRDLDVLLPLLRRLKIPVTVAETTSAEATELEEALRIIRQGCDMSNFGDALNYQIENRRDRQQPFRD